MSKLNIETGQNVLIKKEIASIGSRIGAFFIDTAVMIIYVFVIIAFFSLIIGIEKNNTNENTLIIISLATAPIFFYSLISESLMNGQSIGKKAVNIKVVKMDGSQPSFGNYVIRWVFRLIDLRIFNGIIAIAVIAVNEKGQRIGDIVAKTTVISLKKRETISDTIYVDVDDNHNLSYPEVSVLSVSDIKIVKDVIANYKKNLTSPSANDMIKNTTKAIKDKMNVYSAEAPLLFLEKVMKDYNYINK